MLLWSARHKRMVKNVPLSNDRPFHLRGSSFLMPCNGDDNDADMAIFLHGRHARRQWFFFCTTRGIFLQLTIKREYKRRILFPFIDHFHNLPLYTYQGSSLFISTNVSPPLLYNHIFTSGWWNVIQQSCSVVCFWKGEKCQSREKFVPLLSRGLC